MYPYTHRQVNLSLCIKETSFCKNKTEIVTENHYSSKYREQLIVDCPMDTYKTQILYLNVMGYHRRGRKKLKAMDLRVNCKRSHFLGMIGKHYL